MSNGVQIYGFYGKSGSGKDYLAAVLANMLPNRKPKFVSLADQLKVFSMVEDKLSFDRVYINKDMESRRSLQLRGTELGRNIHGADYWVRYLLAWIRRFMHEGFDTFFVTDVRFPEEYDALRGITGVEGFESVCPAKLYKVISPERTYARRYKETGGDIAKMALIASHPSEIALDHLPDSAFDAIFYNDPGQPSLDLLRDIALEQSSQPFEQVIFLDLDDTITECGIYYEQCKDAAVKHLINWLTLEDPARFRDSEAIDQIALRFEFAFSVHRAEHETKEFSRISFPSALVDAAMETLTFFEQREAPKHRLYDLVDAISTIGLSVNNSPFDALPGALETVTLLQQNKKIKVVVVTVGERPDQVRKLARLGLAGIDCECTLLKSEYAYRQWMLKYPAIRHTMIGDSFVRDIMPSLKAGIKTAIQVGPRRKESNMAGHLGAASLKEAIEMLIPSRNFPQNSK